LQTNLHTKLKNKYLADDRNIQRTAGVGFGPLFHSLSFIYNQAMDKKTRTQYLIYLAMILIGAVFFFSCSRTEPRIPFGFMELIYYPGEGRPLERFSFFVIAEDDDGFENLSELHLINDREGLEWILDSKDWIHHEENGRHWIGSRSITMTSAEILPRGQYKAMLVNKGGEKTLRSLTFDAPDTPRFPYPSLRITDGRYRIDSGYPVNSLIAYDQQGNILRTIVVTDTEGSTANLNVPGGTRLLALWAQDSEYHTSALTEAVAFR
jgi:hypothetical protein